MQRLILLRHGKAESVSAYGGDLERGLTDRGHRDAALMGRVLADAGLAPDLVLVSDARRTRETWDAVSTAFPAARAEHSRSLYLATGEHLAHTVDAAGDSFGCLMIIGHNPGLHELALACLGAGRNSERERMLGSFPTATAAVFIKSAHDAWTLDRILTPRDHGGGVH